MSQSKLVVVLNVIEHKDDQYGRAHFEGWSYQILINTNIRELKDEVVEFLSDTREDLIKQVLGYLEARNLHGILRIT